MHTNDISQLNLAGLKDLQVQVANELKSREALAIADARNQIAAIARSVGKSVKDLLSVKAPSESKKVGIKFRDPSNAKNEWTGRGRSPNWVNKMKEAGTLESARV